MPSEPAQAAFPGTNGKIAFTADREGNPEIYIMDPDGGAQSNLSHNPASDHDPAWSADGTRIAFTSDRDGNSEIYVMNADGTGLTRLTDDAAEDDEAAWSPDGSQIVFASDRAGFRGGVRDLYVMNADGSAQELLATGAGFGHPGPAWSPDGSLIAFDRPSPSGVRRIHTVRPDGTGEVQLTNGISPNWSPDGGFIVFAVFEGIATMRSDGSDRAMIPYTGSYQSMPAWSPEGSDFAVVDRGGASGEEIATMSEIGTHVRKLTDNFSGDRLPDWQPRPPAPAIPGYPHPRGASPIRVALVPASEPCSDPNEVHGPPLAFPSCAPAQQSSSYLTVGTPGRNGQAARSNGLVKLTVVPDPEAGMDVRVAASLTDVRCGASGQRCAGGALSDYEGDLQVSAGIRVTDRLNGHTLDRPATMDRFEFPVTLPCEATSDPAVGGTCSVATSFNAVLPGVVVQGKRAIWQLGQVEVRDGGADGLAESDDYTVFAVQGIFVP
jgi:Tol biopolymer transport system component